MAKIRKPVAKLTKFAKLKVPKFKFKVSKAPKLKFKSTLSRTRWS